MKAIVQTRQAACEALEAIGPAAEGAVASLAKATGEEPDVNPALPYADQRRAQHESFRRAAVAALGAIGGDEAIIALEDAATTPALAEAAQAALEKAKAAS